MVLEGWQKFWDEPPSYSQGIAAPNIRWLKESEEYGLFQPARPYKNSKGQTVARKIFKPKMEFNPPPVPSTIRGSVPNMLGFFTTPVFFWRPVGVMEAKVRCPNSNCPAPSGSYLDKKGYASFARQVCGTQYHYTLLTERLTCASCMKMRQAADNTSDDIDDGTDVWAKEQQQYIWLATSPKILSILAPAVRNMFPVVLCGKRAVDKSVVVLLNDRVNSVSMSKVQRLIKQGHDEWYTERRDLYQTLLYEAHTANNSAQRGILSFIKPAGTYTPPIAQTALPSARTLRRAHMIMEMEKLPDYRASILSMTGEILCIDGTKQILKKISGDGQGTMQYITSVLNEWGQFLTTVVVASESEESYKRLARGLVARFQRANQGAPKVLYTDCNCCRDGGSSYLEGLFDEWVQEGMVVRLDIRHWLHRWDTVIIKQTHAKYGLFMSAMAGAVLAYNGRDMQQLTEAVRRGKPELYAQYTDGEMITFLKPYQVKTYVRRVTRGVEETASAVEAILEEFKGPAGLDIDGIPLFRSPEAVDTYWATACKHLSCMQDPPGVTLYIATKEVNLNGIILNKYKCRRGSNSLEGLHSHMYNAVPSKKCGIMQFQVYLIAFAVQWNARMESLRVAGGRGRVTSCVDPRQIQRLNQQAEVLFGKEHLFEPNFSAPLPHPESYDNPDEEELLGVEYAFCQSTQFSPRNYYIEKVDQEQSQEQEEPDDEEDEDEDEGVDINDASDSPDQDSPLDAINQDHAVLTSLEHVTEETSPALEDVLMSPRHLHLPGFSEVENLAVLLIELSDDTDRYIVSPSLREKISAAAGALHDVDKSSKNFMRQYESKWGYTLFGRCLGPDSPQKSAAQKTKFGWRRYPQAAQINEESRLLYLVIKILNNRPPANMSRSPSKATTYIRAQYKRILHRVQDDPKLCKLGIPLPNINAKSISMFIAKEEKKANLTATVLPKVTRHRKVISQEEIAEAPTLPQVLPPPDRLQVQYDTIPHVAGKRQREKRRLDVEEPEPSTSGSTNPLPSSAPVMMVVPLQPQAPSIKFQPAITPQGGSCFVPTMPPTTPQLKRVLPDKSSKPCAACKVAKCGGLRKRYTPSKAKTEGSHQKIFTFCPTTGRSLTPGFGNIYNSYEHFKEVVDAELSRQKGTGE